MSLIFFRRAHAVLSVLVLWHGALMLAHAQESAAAWGNMLALEKVAGVGPCQAVEADGSRLYATGRGRFHVLDISEPARPRLLGTLKGLGNTRQIFIRGETAFVTARQDGLWLVDVSDAAKPVIISHYDTVEMATGIWVSGQIAYVATRQYGVEIVDVSDPRRPRHLSMLKTGEAQSCWAREGLLYIGDWAPRKLVVADVRDPLAPRIIGSADLDGYGDGGCLRGNVCFAATGHHSRAADKNAGHGKGHGLEIFDVSRPDAPVLLSRVKFPENYQISNDMWTARVSGDHCIVADTWNGLFVVNVRDLKQPEIVARALLPKRPQGDVADPVGGIALGDGVIYAAGIFNGLYVVEAPGMAAPVAREPDAGTLAPNAATDPPSSSDFIAYRPDGQVRSTTVVGDVAWTACGKAGIQAIRLGDDPAALSVTPGKGEVVHVAVVGDRLCAAENAAGLGIYRIAPAMKLKEIGRLTIPERSIKQVVCPPPGRFVLFHCGGSEAFVADVSDPTAPKVVLRDAQVGLFYGDQLVPEMLGGRFMVAFWQRSGPAWYDVGGNTPAYRGNTPDDNLFSFTDGACAFDGRLLIVQRGKLHLLEPGETRNLQALPAFAIEGRRLSGHPTTDGRQLALSRRTDRHVEVLDISDLKTPRLLREYGLPGHPGACAFWNGGLVIPAAYAGLLIERVRP